MQLDSRTADEIRQGFISASITDEQTLSTIADVYRSRDGYLLDPHTAVAMAEADTLSNNFAANTKIVSLATAHPAKFPDVIRKARAVGDELPALATHKSIEAAKDLCQHVRLCDCDKLAPALTRAMQSATKYRTTLSRLG